MSVILYSNAATRAAATTVNAAPPMRTEVAPLPAGVVGAGSLEEAAVPLIAFATFWNAVKLRSEVSMALMALQERELSDKNRYNRDSTYKTIPEPQWLTGVF